MSFLDLNSPSILPTGWTSSLPLVLMILIATVVIGNAPLAFSQTDDPEVEVIQSGNRVMYKFTDEHGNVVVQDTPPEKYFEVDDDKIETPVEIPEPTVEVERYIPQTTTPTWVKLVLWALALISLLAALVVYLLPFLKRARTETVIDRSLRQAGFLSFHDVQLSDGKRRHAQVDRIVKTPIGIMLLMIKKYSGTVSGKPEQKEWRIAGAHDVSMTVNPLLQLEQAMTIIESLDTKVPTFARVVDTGSAKYSDGMPSKIQKLATFKENLARFAQGDQDSRSNDAAWRLLMRFPRSNNITTKHYRDDWLGNVQKYWRELVAGSLIFISVIVIAINLWVMS